MSTFEITYGEEMQIHRRRRGETQRQAADRFGLSIYAYRLLEDAEERPDNAPTVLVRTIADHERFRLLRTREGVSVKDFAERLGISRYWLIQMEAGRQSAAKLAEYWNAVAVA